MNLQPEIPFATKQAGLQGRKEDKKRENQGHAVNIWINDSVKSY